MELDKKVLEEIIGMLEEQEGEKLKKHPKLMAMQVEVEKPKLEVENPESPEVDPVDGGVKEESEDDEELSPEMLKKLLEQLED